MDLPKRDEQRRAPWRMILLASLGGALELYDFVVFGVFASAIGAAFFPTANPLVSQMLAYAGFAIGYFARGLRYSAAYGSGSTAERLKSPAFRCRSNRDDAGFWTPLGTSAILRHAAWRQRRGNSPAEPRPRRSRGRFFNIDLINKLEADSRAARPHRQLVEPAI
jgi:hypothetical protein